MADKAEVLQENAGSDTPSEPVAKRKKASLKSLIPVVVMAVIGLVLAPINLPDYTAAHGVWYVIILALGYLVSHFCLDWPTSKRGRLVHDIACFFIAAVTCFLMSELAYLSSIQQVFFYEGSLRLSNCLMCLSEILLAMVLFSFITRRWRRGCQIVFGLVAFIAFVNAAVFTMRGSPLTPSDLLNIRTGLGMAVTRTGIDLPAGILCAVGLLYMGVAFTYRIHQVPKPLFPSKSRKFQIGARIVRLVIALAVSGGVFAGVMYAHRSTSFFQNTFNYERINWSPKDNVWHNGFVATFLDKMATSAVAKPAGYSELAILDEVSLQLLGETGLTEEQLLEALSGQLAASGTVKPNIIFIQNESLVDFETSFARGTYSEEVMPFVHSLYGSDEALTGTCRPSVLGGSTITTEWEVLTGNSSWYMRSAAPFQDLAHNDTPTIVSKLADQGYTCEAIHPSDGDDYDRNVAYAKLGFTEFFDEEAFDGERDSYGEYISDEASYRLALERFEVNDGPVFIFDITMQNHFPYDDVEPKFRSVFLEEFPSVTTFSVYLTRVRESDRAFQAFLEELEKLDEPTVVVMYGDHGPRVYDSDLNDFLWQPLEGESDLDAYQRFNETPLIMWSNYGLQGGDLGNVSPNYVSSLALQFAGLETTPYDLYLLKLRETLPVVDAEVYEYPDTLSHLWAEMTEDEEGLAGYRYLQYNMLYDRGHLVSSLFTVPSGLDG